MKVIVGFLIEGDLCDLDELLIGVHLDHGVEAMSRAMVAARLDAALKGVCSMHTRELPEPSGRKPWSISAIKREWVVNLGRRSAYERILASLLRNELPPPLAGRSNDESFWWPVTQVHMADAMGLTTVHVNRAAVGARGTDPLSIATNRRSRTPRCSRLMAPRRVRARHGFSSDYFAKAADF